MRIELQMMAYLDTDGTVRLRHEVPGTTSARSGFLWT